MVIGQCSHDVALKAVLLPSIKSSGNKGGV